MAVELLDENPVAGPTTLPDLASAPTVNPPAPGVNGSTGAELVDSEPVKPPADVIYQLMRERPDYWPSREDAQTLFDFEKGSPVDKAGRYAKGFVEGLPAMAKPFVDLPGEVIKNGADVPKLLGSVAEGVGRGTAMWTDLARRLGSKAYDEARNLDATEAEKVDRFHQRILNNLNWERTLARGGDGRGTLGMMTIRPDGSIGGIPGATKVPESQLPIPSVAEASSYFLPPLPPVLAGAKDLLGPAAKAVGRVLPEALTEAAAKAGRGIAKLNPVPKIPAAVEATGAGLKAVGSLPEKVGSALADKYLPEALQPAAEKLTHLTGMGSVAAQLTGHGTPLGAIFAALKGLDWGGGVVERSGQFLKELGATAGDSQIPRLLQLANKPGVPPWIQNLAKGLDQVGAGTAMQMGTDLAKGAAHGAATGAVLGAATTETPEEAGRMAGGGALLGMAGRGISKLTGADAKQRAAQQRLGDLGRFFLHLKEQGVPDETILKIQDTPAMMASALQAATARGVFHNQINFKFLEGPAYTELAKQSGAGTAAFHDPASNTIVVNVDADRKALTHEIGHAALKAAGADSEARLLIHSIFSPEQVTVMGREYAQKLVDGQLKSAGQDPATLNPAEYQQRVNDKVQELNDAHKGDKWIYDEVYADAAYGGLLGKDIKRDVISNGLFSRLRQAGQEKILSALGETPERTPNGALFSNPEVYNNPALRQMVYQHLRDLYRNGPSENVAKETKEGLPVGTPVPKDLIGKHPAAPVFPNPATGRMENDFAVVDPKNGEVTLRSPREVKQIERSRQAEVKEVTKEVAKQPVLPPKSPTEKPGTEPASKPVIADSNLAPRKNAGGVVEIVGTKIKGLLDRLTRFGEEAKKNAALAEGMMGTGDVIDTWYQAAGTGPNWKGDVRRRLANVAASKVKLAPFLFKVSKEGNVLVVGLSLNAVDRKLARWSQNENSLLNHLWGGDPEQFKTDLATYLKNHADGRPGADTIGDKKRDALNVFVVGDHRALSKANPLRDDLRGVEKQGIIRSLRLDRMMNAERSAEKGWTAEHEKKIYNLSPDSPDIDTGGIVKGGDEKQDQERDPVTGVSTVFTDSAGPYDVARQRIGAQAKAAAARDVLIALLEERAKERGQPFDRAATWRAVAKTANDPAISKEVGTARRLLTLSPQQFEQEKAAKVLPLPVQEAAEKARALLPTIPDSEFARSLDAAIWGSEVGDRVGNLRVIGKGGEGPVLKDPKQPGFVYKVFAGGLHLSDVNKLRDNGNNRLTVKDNTLLDTLSKIDRLSRLPGGLPIEIQGLSAHGFLVAKMPELVDEASPREVQEWMRKYGHESAKSRLSGATASGINPIVGLDQPILKDEHGNSYASADVRQDFGTGNYPNLMTDRNGNVWATDVLTRPIDQADIERYPYLAEYTPEQPDKILYSPDVNKDEAGQEDDSVARHRGIDMSQAAKERVGTTGQYVGAPEGVNAPRHVQKILDQIEKAAREGEAGRFWYEDSSKAILDITGQDKKDAEMLAALVAVTSPNNKVYPNMSMAVKAYYQAKAGLPITAGKTAQMARAAQRVVDGERWEGVKTNNFYINLMRKIDPTLSQGVTVDMWIMRLLGYRRDAPSPTQYTWAANQIARAAAKMGWEPQQVQAAMWVAGKSRWEVAWPDVKALAIRNGDLAAKGNKYGKPEWVPKEKQKYYRDLALRRALNLKEGSFDIVNFNFGHALARDMGQISWESRPGTTTDDMPGMAKATYPQLAEYHVAIARALSDENGHDIVAKETGLLSPGAFDAPGVWKDQNNPSTQVGVVAPRAGVEKVGEGKSRKSARKVEVDPTVRDSVTDYCAMLGLLLKQDAVGWHRPFYTDVDQAKVGDANMVELNFHRPLTVEETKRFQQEFIKTLGGESFALIGWQKGLRLMNFSDLDNPAWHGKVKETVNRFTDGLVGFKRITSVGDLIENNWKEHADGQNYRSRIRESRRPDLLGRVYDLLHEKIERVNADFARKYGWDKRPGQPGAEIPQTATPGAASPAVKEPQGLSPPPTQE